MATPAPLMIFALFLFGSLLSPTLLADTVQRWQDHSGQWHFGDHAAAKDHASKAVVVNTPISIIKNDQPVNLATTEFKNPRAKTSKAKKKLKTTLARQKDQCDELRQQLYNRSLKAKKSSARPALVERYERECISGQYYGNS